MSSHLLHGIQFSEGFTRGEWLRIETEVPINWFQLPHDPHPRLPAINDNRRVRDKDELDKRDQLHVETSKKRAPGSLSGGTFTPCERVKTRHFSRRCPKTNRNRTMFKQQTIIRKLICLHMFGQASARMLRIFSSGFKQRSSCVRTDRARTEN